MQNVGVALAHENMGGATVRCEYDDGMFEAVRREDFVCSKRESGSAFVANRGSGLDVIANRRPSFSFGPRAERARDLDWFGGAFHRRDVASPGGSVRECFLAPMAF